MPRPNASKILVNLAIDFAAECETLPVGTYRVSRVSTEAPPDFVIHSDDKGALLLPIVFDGVSGEQATTGLRGEATTMRATEEQERETFIAIKRTCQ
jgi:hypothetical protein